MDLDCQQHFCDRRLMVRIVSWPKGLLRLMDMWHWRSCLDTENAVPKAKRVEWCLSILFFEPRPFVCRSFVDLYAQHCQVCIEMVFVWHLGCICHRSVSTFHCRSVQVAGLTSENCRSFAGMFSTFQTLCTSSSVPPMFESLAPSHDETAKRDLNGSSGVLRRT